LISVDGLPVNLPDATTVSVMQATDQQRQREALVVDGSNAEELQRLDATTLSSTRAGSDRRCRRRGPKARQTRGQADESTREAHHPAWPLHSTRGGHDQHRWLNH
jgi:hypothetical protein